MKDDTEAGKIVSSDRGLLAAAVDERFRFDGSADLVVSARQ